MINIKVKYDSNLIDYLNFEGLNYNKVQTLLRKKEIKVNKERVNKNISLKKDDEINIFTSGYKLFKIERVFEDDNILIVNKPKKLEVVSTTRDISLITLLNPNFIPVHRLDYNTEGLVIIAKSKQAKEELIYAFKNNLILKEYVCIVFGNLFEEKILKDYLVKLEDKVKIFNSKVVGSNEIRTRISPIENYKNYCLLKAELITGKTHQIRAQLAFNNLFILGDEKYGKIKVNKELKLNNQVLMCYHIKFKFDNKIKFLNYLNNKEFNINYDNILNIFNSIKKNK